MIDPTVAPLQGDAALECLEVVRDRLRLDRERPLLGQVHRVRLRGAVPLGAGGPSFVARGDCRPMPGGDDERTEARWR